jgi:hypothetical protein
VERWRRKKRHDDEDGGKDKLLWKHGEALIFITPETGFIKL